MHCRAVALALAFLALTGGVAEAAPYYYVDWTSANPGAGTAAGVINLPGGSTVNVTFKATFANGSPGTFFFGQTTTGTNFWNPTTPYVSAQVSNAPPPIDILALEGGQNQIYTVTLSEPIKDPIMAILSLGRTNLPTTYDFDSPFTIVSQGVGFFGGGATALTQLPGDVLRGAEGHGTIQFIGTFATFSWVVPTPESWHGFTFGIRTTQALEPTIPEPTTLALVAVGGVALLGARRLRRPRAT